jgi:hypothetical protein
MGNLIWLSLGAIICLSSSKLSLGNLKSPGPGFLPFVTGVLMMVLAIVQFFQSTQNALQATKKQKTMAGKKANLKVFLTITALIGYAVGMEYLGFFLSTLLFIWFLLRIIEPHGRLVVLISSITIALSSYIIFELWFQLQLPRGFILLF